MREDILLSVIIPVYNLENYIVPCIRSVIHNKGVASDSFEVIVVNDGSSDLSRQRVEECISANPEYHISLYNQDNKGVSAARNLGLEKARGKYVWFVDGDDAITSDALNFLLNVLETTDCEIVNIANPLQYILFEDNSVISQTYFKAEINAGKKVNAYELFHPGYSFDHVSYLWRKSFLIEHELKYPVAISQNEDFDFLIKALMAGTSAYVNMSCRFYLYRERKDSVSRKKPDYLGFDKFLQNKFRVLEDIMSLRKFYKNDNLEKVNVLERYADRYIYSIVADCFFRRLPFSLTLYTIQKLRALQLYPIKRIEGVSSFRIWLFNRWFLFMAACSVYKLFKF